MKLLLPEWELRFRQLGWKRHPKLELHFRQLGWKRDAGIPIPATSGCLNQRSRPKGVITILVTDNNSDSGN
ncbi:MAG: hypothetical protein WBI53_11375 [Paludibacter sp.]